MSSTVLRWLRPVLPLLVVLAVVGIVGMHALSSDHTAHGTTPTMTMHTSIGTASAESGNVSREPSVHRHITPPTYPAGDSDCVPALLSTATPISAPAVTVAIVPPPVYRVGAEFAAREIAPPRPSLVVLSISRT